MIVDKYGITKKTEEEIRQDIIDIFQENFPNFILTTNSPQGNVIELFVQKLLDVQDFSVDVKNQLSLLTAEGRWLDLLGLLRNVFRKSGVYTIQNIDITVNAPVNLYGVSSNETTFKISDGNGNNYLLLDNKNYVSAGTYTASFRAEKLGAVESNLNTITNILTNVIGVESVNNSSSPSTIGQTGEFDPAFRERILSTGTANAVGTIPVLQPALLNLSGVTDVFVQINRTNSTEDGIPKRHLYAIIEGGSPADIAKVFYQHTSTTPFHGDETYNYETEYENFIIAFDRPNEVDFYLKFELQETNGGLDSGEMDIIKDYIVDNAKFSINEAVDVAKLSDIVHKVVQQQDLKAFAYDFYVSLDNSTWVRRLTPAQLKNKLKVEKANITINIV